MDQERSIKQFLEVYNDRIIQLQQRVYNLESAEYSALNFYGGMYQFNLGTIIAIGAANTYYTVTGMVTNLVKGFTFAASQLTCTKAGIYSVIYNISFSSMAANLTKTAILVNSGVASDTVSRVLPSTAQDHLSGGGLLDLSVNDIISLAINNETDADDPTIDYASVFLSREGD